MLANGTSERVIVSMRSQPFHPGSDSDQKASLLAPVSHPLRRCLNLGNGHTAFQ